VAIAEGSEEAALVAFMTHTGAESFDLEENGVPIAVGGDGLYHQAVTGRFAFEPELVPGPAEEGCEAALDGLSKRFFVHEAEHEDAAGLMVLNDGGHEPVEFAEVEFHVESNKKARRVRAGCFALWLRTLVLAGPSRHTMPVVMVMMMCSGHAGNHEESG
jgi:hypothetical protein